MKRLLNPILSHIAHIRRATIGVLLFCSAIILTLTTCSDDGGGTPPAFVCDNGTPADGATVANSGENKCKHCDANYLLNETTFSCEEHLAFVHQPDKDGDITANTATITLTVNKNATIHWIVYADGIPQQDALTLIASAKDPNIGIARSGEGVESATAGNPVTIAISGLAAATDYDFYAVATTDTSAETIVSQKYDLRTTIEGIPGFHGNPTIDTTSRTGTTITLTTDEATKLYWVVYDKQQKDLTAQALISAATGTNTSNGEVKRGAGTNNEGVGTHPNSPHSIPITDLTHLTTYFFYAAIVDSDNNHTRSPEVPFTTIGYPYRCEGGTAVDGFDAPTDSVNRCKACDNNLPPNSVFACEATVSFSNQPTLDTDVAVTANTATITLTVNKDVTIHWVLYADGIADTLDAATVIEDAADNATVGIARSGSNGTEAKAGIPLTIPITQLTATTHYDFYAVATATNPAETLLSNKYDLQTTETGVPTFITQPYFSPPSRTGTTITFKIDEAVKLYWVVYDKQQKDLTAPALMSAATGTNTSNGEVKRGAGTDSKGITVDANDLKQITITGLSQLTDYYFYASIVDSDGNHTLSSEAFFATIGHPYTCEGGTKADGFDAPTSNVNKCKACNNGLSPNSLFACEEALSLKSQPDKDGDITANAATITLTVNKDATIHWVLYADGTAAPDAATVIKDAADSSTVGIARSGSDGIAAKASIPLTIPITQLTATTHYDFYAVATATDPAETLLSNKYDLLTTKAGVPTFITQPAAHNPSRTGTTVTLTADEAGNLYWVVYDKQQKDLTAQVLISAATGTGTTNGEVKRGAGTNGEGIDIDATNQKSITITGLSQLTDYYFYASIVDSDGNHTLSSEAFFATIGHPYACEGGTADSSSQAMTNNVNKCSTCDNGLSPNSLFACEDLLTFSNQPANAAITANTASVTITVNKDATIYWVVYADGVTPPNATAVIADSKNSSAGKARSGSDDITARAGMSLSLPLSGLTANTAYDMYVVATATDPTEQVVSNVLNLSTNNQGVANFSTPTTSTILSTRATVTLTADEDTKLYWVVYNTPQDNLTAPALVSAATGTNTTNGEVKRGAGTNNAGITLTANTPQPITITGLTLRTAYYFYATIVDSDGNHTLSSVVPFTTIGYLYECSNGTPTGGYTTVQNQNHCAGCDTYYRLNDDDNSCVATKYVCAHGNPVTGSPQSNNERITNADINKCKDCDTGYYKSGDSCKEGGIDTAITISAMSDTTMTATIAVDAPTDIPPSPLYWVLYAGTQQTKTIAQVTADATNDRGVARNENDITITQDMDIPISIRSLSANTTYTLYVSVDTAIDSVIFDTHGPNSNYGVDFDVYCNVQSKYIPTDFSDSITGTNGATPTEKWTPSFNELGQLPNGHRAQRDCYKYGYYYRQSLPDIPPVTTSTHTNSLPSGMFYDRSKYKLVFEEDFGPNTSTNPHNTDNKFKIGTDEEQQVNLYKIFEGLQNNRDEEFTVAKLAGHGKSSHPASWPGLDKNGNEPSWLAEYYSEDEQKEIRAALQNEWAWPAYIKDGRFYAGMGRVSLNHVGTRHIYYCRTITVYKGKPWEQTYHTRRVHDFDNDPYSLNGNVETCECEEDTATGCAYFFGSWTGSNIKFQYGFLEIDVAEMMLSAGNGSKDIYNFLWLPSSTSHTPYKRTGRWAKMLSTSNDEGYFELKAIEFQLMEQFISKSYGGSSGWWLVKHYYPPSRHPTDRDSRWSRFFDTYRIRNTRTNPTQIKARKLGVEWTPRGYRIWEAQDGGSWVDLSTTSGWSLSGVCGNDDKVNGFWQCGISHVVASIKHSGIAGTGEMMRTRNPRYVFNHFRIYQPEGNYSELERIYK